MAVAAGHRTLGMKGTQTHAHLIVSSKVVVS